MKGKNVLLYVDNAPFRRVLSRRRVVVFFRSRLVVIEVTDTGFSAYSPDLPGCVSTGATRQEVEANMKEAIEFHLDGLKQERYPIPEPTADSMYVKIESEV